MKPTRTLLLLVTMLASQALSAAEETYVISRAPQQSVLKTEKQWLPLIKYLNKTTGYRFRLKVYEARARFENDIMAGRPDLFFGNPGYYIAASQKHPYLPLVRSNKGKSKGIVVVRKNSDYTRIEQLNGRKIAFPDKSAFLASLYIRSQLSKVHNISFMPVYVGGHDNVYRNVLAGKVEAGGGVYRSLKLEPEALRRQLRVIHETPGVAPHPLVIHKRVPAKVRKAILKAILDLNKTETGKKMLKTVKLKKPVAANHARDYEPVKKMSLDMYKFLIKKPRQK